MMNMEIYLQNVIKCLSITKCRGWHIAEVLEIAPAWKLYHAFAAIQSDFETERRSQYSLPSKLTLFARIS